MSIRTFVTALTLTTSLLAGCAPQAPQDLLSAEQDLKGNGGTWDASNSSQATGGSLLTTTIKGLFYSTTAPQGQSTSPTGWWLRSRTSDQHARVLSITFNGQAVSALSTSQGWLQATVNGTTRRVTADDVIELQIGAPLASTLRLSGSQDHSSYGTYAAQWRADGATQWNSFCPHLFGVNSDGENLNQTEYVIPVGGAYWNESGARINNSASIQLSCTHDSIGACVTWGYAPWDSVSAYTGTPPKLTTTSLLDTHQACTRMKRNDVCGTGDPVTTLDQYTAVHTMIQVWDVHGIHTNNPQTASTMEAFWGPSGATCYNVGQYRSTDSVFVDHLEAQLRLCPKPACDMTLPGLLGSARPCLAVDADTGECVQN